MPPDTTPPASIGLELRNVSKYFGDLAALAGAQLRVKPGEAILLYGPNGAGKTTLLRLLATLARPSEGEVLFGGENVRRHAARAKAAIGFVSHSTFLYGDLTVRENLRFFGTLYALPRLEKQIDAALESFALGDRARTPVRKLSRGLQQRVSLARAFLHDPQFLLLDEPFTGLDAATVSTIGIFHSRFQTRRRAGTKDRSLGSWENSVRRPLGPCAPELIATGLGEGGEQWAVSRRQKAVSSKRKAVSR